MQRINTLNMSNRYFFRPLLGLTLAALVFSCSDDDNGSPTLRSKIEYTTLTPTAEYSSAFVDASGSSTVDLKDGNYRHKMFQGLNYHSSSSIGANTQIDGEKLSDMFSNVNDPFVDVTTSSISIVGADLNASDLQLKNIVASSLSATDAAEVRDYFEDLFEHIAVTSESVEETASAGVAGKLGTYLVDDRGIEPIQIIQKSLIGALQLDYISNVLLDGGLSANNTKVVEGKKYSALEHNWDVAYGLLTLNEVYLLGATDQSRNSVEFALGSYIWEYNKANYAKIHPAFLKGRAAIVNNDAATLREQATFIRTQMEKSIAAAAVGYLNKWKTGETEAARAHAMGEGLGFIYSLRFAKIHGGTAAFSESIIDDLVGSEGGFWDLDVDKINDAIDAIEDKFDL